MKVAPVSGDLLVKLGLFAVAGLGVWLMLQQVRASLPTLPSWDFDMPTPTWQWGNPASDQNLIYQGTSGIVSAVIGRDETLGGWLYDLTHPDPMGPPRPPLTNLGITPDGAYDQMGNRIY